MRDNPHRNDRSDSRRDDSADRRDPHRDGPADRRDPSGVDSDDRCDAMELYDGDVVLYDRENADAWIQSSVAIDFSDLWSTGAA